MFMFSDPRHCALCVAASSCPACTRAPPCQVITPECVLSWQRVRTANLLAASGAEWVALFKKHNSGT